MPRWPWRAEQSNGSKTDSIVAQLPREDATPIEDDSSNPSAEGGASELTPVTLERVAEALERLEIRYLTDGDGSLFALWERHAVLFALEGPSDEILVIRARPHATVPPTWTERAFQVVNEWNHTRRFYKAYVGDPTDRGQLPIYAEMQVPLLSGAHDAFIAELVDCAAVVTLGFVDWLHDEGALL